MDELEGHVGKGRSVLILIVVLLGIGGVSAGGYLAWSRQSTPAVAGGGSTAGPSGDFAKWCELRKEWAKEMASIDSDLMLKGARPQDKEDYGKLAVKRNQLCEEHAKKLRELFKDDPSLFEKLRGVEEAFVKEGKVRANVSVEIANHLAKVGSDITGEVRAEYDGLTQVMPKRIADARAAAKQEVAVGLKAIGGECPGLYRGTMLDQGTADSPYISWDELEMRRRMAVTQLGSRLKELEPVEEFTKKVQAEIVGRYRPVLVECYHKIKRVKPDLSEKMGMRVRLKRSGEVKTLAIEWMDKRDDRLLDCILDKAAKWKLPPPEEKTQVVVVTIDFSKL